MFDRLYHVPRSQVWPGSGARQVGHVHLHVREQFDLGRIHRSKGRALCGRRGWWERPLDRGEVKPECPRCAEISGRIPTTDPVAAGFRLAADLLQDEALRDLMECDPLAAQREILKRSR